MFWQVLTFSTRAKMINLHFLKLLWTCTSIIFVFFINFMKGMSQKNVHNFTKLLFLRVSYFFFLDVIFNNNNNFCACMHTHIVKSLACSRVSPRMYVRSPLKCPFSHFLDSYNTYKAVDWFREDYKAVINI